MPRLVRRQPLSERVKAYLDPFDFLLWLSEEFDSNDWDQFEKDWAFTLGIGLNLLFLVARANSGRKTSRAEDDVFGDDTSNVSFVTWLASFLVHLLTLLSLVNAYYTFSRKRRYRMFESSIDKIPSTPSVQRVRVNSVPASPSPWSLLTNLIAGETAESRRHPDPTRDVWELSIWDPFPLSLRVFCLFSPGHVLVYWLFLPTLISDPRPSVTVVTTVILAILLSVQLQSVSSAFSQQVKDSLILHKEVLNEYDTKFVLPKTHPLMRDVGVQYAEENARHRGSDNKYNNVDTYTPTHIINRGFKTSPNPNYLAHVDPDGASKAATSPSRRQSFASPSITLPHNSTQTPTYISNPSPAPLTSMRQPQFNPPTSMGDGGSLGVYSHANSPLRKSASAHFEPRSMNHVGSSLSPAKRQSSPLKRTSTPGGLSTPAAAQRWGHLADLKTHRRESDRF